MHKLIAAVLLLVLFVALQARAFANSQTLNCKFKYEDVAGIKSIQVSNDHLIINKELAIPLEQSEVNCANFGRQIRLDGAAAGYQVILKSCSSDVQLEGHLIDSVNSKVADVVCDHGL